VRGGAKATVDHDEIRRWVEEHGGKPAVVKKTADGKSPGILRVDFPGFSGQQTLEELDWDDWFERFESAKLAFLYQDQTGSGRPSRFNKLVARESAELGPQRGSARKLAAPRASAKKRSAQQTNGARGKRRGTSTRAAAKGKKTSTARSSSSSSRTKPTSARGAKRRSRPQSGRAKRA
jgi:hypothetical protein